MIGHRGARGHAPENTLVAFARGAELGAELVECDVHLSSDGELVVIHDETIDRTTSGHGRVRDLEAREFARLDAGGGQHVPLLAELLEVLADRRAPGIVVEIKNGPEFYPDIARKVVETLERFSMTERSLVISFDHLAVRQAKLLRPALATGILYHARLVDPAGAAHAARADSIWPSVAMLTPEVAEAAHQAGLAVFTWTANSADEMDRALAAPADGIGSDFPDRLVARIG